MIVLVDRPLPSTPDPRDPGFRLAELLDHGSILALHAKDSSGVLALRGRLDGGEVIAYRTDGTRMGGVMGTEGCRHIVAAVDAAMCARVPVIGVWNSGGVRPAECVEALDAVGLVFAAMIRASGRVPRISVVAGPAAGSAAYGPALTDVVIMVPAGRVFVTGRDVVRSVTGEVIDQEGIGGAEAHGRTSGVVHVFAADEPDAYARAPWITSLFALPGRFDLASDWQRRDPAALLPQSARRACDIRPVIREILDATPEREELRARRAPNIVVGLGRPAGHSVGVIACNPLRKSGCLDSLPPSARRSARHGIRQPRRSRQHPALRRGRRE